MEQGIFGQIRRAPLGVVLCMGPFNYPLNETYTSVIPALIMGNTVIFKPPKLGVLLHYPFLAAFQESLPPGVINTVYGRGAQVVGPLMASGQVDVLAFIGTSKVADILKKQHPKPHRLRAALGLEAKNPAIIMPDADLDLTVAECLLGALSFNGQRCTALKLLFVHREILPQFLEKFTAALNGLKFGMPWEAEVMVTPLPESSRPAYLTELVADAKAKGARVVNESGGAVNQSFFYPAILYPVDDRMRVYHEEQFGPVIPVVPFDDTGNGHSEHRGFRIRPAGVHFLPGPRHHRPPGGSAGDPGGAGKHQQPVPAGARHLPLYGAQGFRRGDAVGPRRPAGFFPEDPGGRQGDGDQQNRGHRHRPGA